MKQRILYIHPSSSQKRDSQVVIPIGMIGIVNKILENKEVEVYAVSVPLEEQLNPKYNILDEIKGYNPTVVMVDLHWAIYSYSSIQICKIVKQYNNNIITIVGGITASIYYKEIMEKYKEIDYIIRGDAEHTIIPLIRQINENKLKLEDIPNLVYRENDKIIETEKLVKCVSFDNMDYSNYDFVKNATEFLKKQGIHKGVAINKGLAWLPTARGCSCNCTYCGGNKNMFKDTFQRQTVLFNSAKNITGYMSKLYDKYGIDVFGITHTFEIFPDKIQEEIIEEIKQLSFKPAMFYYLFQMPNINKFKKILEVINQKKTVIGLSLMSGDEHIRSLNGKPFSNDDLINLLDVLKDTDVKVELYFIDNLKFNSKKAFEDTKGLIKKLYSNYKEKYKMNIEISYGFEIIQPLSEKAKEETVFKSFKDYYYRYSPQFDIDISKGEKKEYLIGESVFDKERYKRLKEVNELIYELDKKTKKNVDVIYVCPPSCKQKEFEKTIGLAYLEAYIKEKGFVAKQFIPTKLDVESIVESIVSLSPKIVGFSVYDTNYYYSKLLAEKIKRKNPNIVIVAGGPTATFNSKLLMNDTFAFDYCQKGYGEKSSVKLLEYEIKYVGSLEEIAGLVYRKNGEIFENEVAKLDKNIDVFPSPYLSDIDFFPERKIVFTSRGCVHNCVYCNCKSMCNGQVYYHSIDRVISELKYISDKSPNDYVLIGDDAFTLNINRAKEICKRILEENIKLRLFCETRVDRIDDELLELLKKSGFIKIDFGLESAVPRVLRNIKKIFYSKDDTTYKAEKKFLEVMRWNVEKTKQLGLDPMLNIITGLPGESIEDAKETLEYIKSLQLNSYSHNYLKIYSGTELYNNYSKQGYKIEQDAFKLPYIVKYPKDINVIRPLHNSVNRNEIVRIKNELIRILQEPKSEFNIEKLIQNVDKLKSIDINQELFVWVKSYDEINKVAEIIVNNRIPTNNINYILEEKNRIKCFNNLDRENYICAIKIDSSDIQMPKDYNEFIYVENMEEQKDKFKKRGINPYVNRFVVIKDRVENKDKDYWKQLLEDYENEYKPKTKEILMKFIEYIKFDIDNITLNMFRDIIKEEKFNKQERNVIIEFLKYYLLGVIDNGR